ncbi:MAG: hypothetical protein AB8B73_15050 [Ekhidna sp.]
MQEEEKIAKINQTILDYFEQKTKENSVAVKELMPHFIKAGVFTKDNKKGKPIRDILRSLDKENQLAKIPSAHGERKEKNTFWYFLREGSAYVSDSPNDTGATKRQKQKAKLASSDEHYVINLCDELLKEEASRQHEFSFLLSDYNKEGTRTSLPVDAYYREKNLVIELLKRKQTEETGDVSDSPRRMTAGARNREEQRRAYYERKKKGLLAKNIQLLEVDYTVFEFDTQNNIIRDKEKNMKILSDLLKSYNEELWSSLSE